jgi:hypothetical protein
MAYCPGGSCKPVEVEDIFKKKKRLVDNATQEDRTVHNEIHKAEIKHRHFAEAGPEPGNREDE